jgi:hypothetical protein
VLEAHSGVQEGLKSVLRPLRPPSRLVTWHEEADCVFGIFKRKHGNPCLSFLPITCVTITKSSYFHSSVKLTVKRRFEFEERTEVLPLKA